MDILTAVITVAMLAIKNAPEAIAAIKKALAQFCDENGLDSVEALRRIEVDGHQEVDDDIDARIRDWPTP